MKELGDRRKITGKLKWLMLVRVALVSILLGMSLFVTGMGSRPFFAIIGFVCCATFVYALLLRTSVPVRIQAYAQFFTDAGVITALLAFTGGIDSEFVLLYVLPIVYGSTIIGGQAGISLAVTCSAMYAVLGFVESFGLLPQGVGVAGRGHADYLYAGYLVLVRATIFCILGHLGDYLVNTIYRERLELDRLKRLNERIMAEMKSGLITTDPYGKVIFVNDIAAEILGYRAREMIGRSWSVLLGSPVDDIDDTWLAEKARSFTRCEIRVNRKDGLEIPIGFTISNLVDKSGVPLGLLILFRDLTPIYRMEERMRRADRLSAAGAILTSVAHEVRTPLASIQGAVELLKEGGQEADSRKKLMDVILKESDRLNRIVSDFLSYGRTRDETRAREDISGLLDEVIQLVKQREGAGRVEIVRRDGSAPVHAEVDAARIKQVFINIMDNALDAVRGKGRVTVSLERRWSWQEGRPVARVRFEDTGEGMSAERMSHLFEPFYSTKESGTGMGLFIAEGIVRNHGGQIEAESAVGKGTAFTVTLPCEPGEAPARGEEDAACAGS